MSQLQFGNNVDAVYAADAANVDYVADAADVDYAADPADVDYAADAADVNYASDAADVDYVADAAKYTANNVSDAASVIGRSSASLLSVEFQVFGEVQVPKDQIC